MFAGIEVLLLCSDDDGGRGRRVAKSNCLSGSEGQDGTRESFTALGGTDCQVDRAIGNRTRISGAGIENAGCNKSEMKRIISTEEELS